LILSDFMEHPSCISIICNIYYSLYFPVAMYIIYHIWFSLKCLIQIQSVVYLN